MPLRSSINIKLFFKLPDFDRVGYIFTRAIMKRLILLLLLFTHSAPLLADVLVATGTAIVKVEDGTPSTFISQAATSLFYESVSEKLYFSDGTGIYRADRDGSNVATIIANVGSTVGDLVVDTANEKIIWTEPDETRLRKSDLDGGNIAIHYNGTSLPEGIIIDQDGGKVYWAAAAAIESTNLDGSGYAEIYFDGDNFGVLQFLTLYDSTFYFTDGTQHQLKSVDINGDNEKVLASGVTNPQGVSFDSDEYRIYYIGTTEAAALSSIKSDGSGKTSVASTKGYDIIAGYYASESEEPVAPIATPAPSPVPTPAATPAPQKRPPYTRMYMSIQNKTNPDESRIVWTSFYGEVNEVTKNFTDPRALGYSKEENSLYVIERATAGSSKMFRVAPDGSDRTEIFHLPYKYEFMHVDDESDRVFLGQAEDDFGTFNRDARSTYRLFNNPSTNGKGFGKYDGKSFITQGKKIYSFKSDYNIKKNPNVTHESSFSRSTLLAIQPYDLGNLMLLKDPLDLRQFIYSKSGGDDQEPGYLLYQAIRGKGYEYTDIEVQHLDPETFTRPYSIYLISGNKVDVLYFSPEPRVIPFLRFAEDEVVTDIVEVPIVAATQDEEEVDSTTIKGSFRFVDFSTDGTALDEVETPSYAGIHVHLSAASEDTQTENEDEDDISQSTRRTITDESGNYEFTGLKEGRKYTLRFSRPDLSFTSKELSVQAGTVAPRIAVKVEDFSEFECTTKESSRNISKADQNNEKIVNFAIEKAQQRIEKASGKKLETIQSRSNALNNLYAELLENSRDLPSVQIRCEKSATECTLQNKKKKAKSYRKKSKRVSKQAKKLIQAAFGKSKAKRKILKRIQKLTKAASKAAKKLPSKTYECPVGTEETEPEGGVE